MKWKATTAILLAAQATTAVAASPGYATNTESRRANQQSREVAFDMEPALSSVTGFLDKIPTGVDGMLWNPEVQADRSADRDSLLVHESTYEWKHASSVGLRGSGDPPPEPCREGALFGQRVAIGDVGVDLSDSESGYIRYENFWDVRGVISGLSWYGVFVELGIPFGCGSEPREFEVTFYEDLDGSPGPEVTHRVFTISGEPSNREAGIGAFATRYAVDLDPPVVLRDGWVSIVGAGEPDGCAFAWLSDPLTDPPGDGRRCTGHNGEIVCNVPGMPSSWDLNLCILGTFFPGACCDDLAHDCSDGVDYADCPAPMRFEADTLCSELDPACGDITGACCDGESCTVLTPSECFAVGGEYKGDGVSCDPNVCVGACCLGLGECQILTEGECVGFAGDYMGGGTGCDPLPCRPANDDCAYAALITEEDTLFDTTNATLDGPESCELEQNAWYCYTASDIGTVTVQVEPYLELWSPSVAAYDGCACDPHPTAMACDLSNNGQIEFDVVEGNQYLIEVGKGPGGFSPIKGGLGTLSISLDAWDYGACCSIDAPHCVEAYGHECQGTFAGDDTTCEPTDCNGSGISDTCDIALGLSGDCNNNGIPDECDIIAGNSLDYDLNGVPDSCDPDCNKNGITDRCDIACAIGDCGDHPVGCGGSSDCQPDSVPDECQLGIEEGLLWDNGQPGYSDQYRTLASQYGGLLEDVIIADDFHLPNGGRITSFHANFEDEPDFFWSGRVRIEVYADNGEGHPDDSDGPMLLRWVPTDCGAVTRTSLDVDFHENARRYDVTGLDVQLGSGTWWIGMASEGFGNQAGLAAWASSRAGDNVVTNEAHVRCAAWNLPSFTPSSVWWPVAYDVSFSIGGAVGADCDENGIPDDCDMLHCEGLPWCQDCNEDGFLDGCQPDCNVNGVPDDCDLRDCDGSLWCGDCNGNAILDSCDLSDCDGSIWCDDCNEDQLLDQCQIGSASGETYQFDDGSAETSLGAGSSTEIAWIQRFDTVGDTATIDGVATAFGSAVYPGSAGVLPGDTVRVFVWADPEQTRNPSEAILVAEAESTINAGSIGTDVLQVVSLAPVTVSGSFFVGASVVSEAHPAPLDQSEPLGHESWIAYGALQAGGFDPTDFYANSMDAIMFPGDWLLRALTPLAAPENDCNGNGIPDNCEQCGDFDDDEDVDYYDYVIFLDAFGGVTDGVPAEDWCCDYDHSGAVGMADFAAWLECYRDYVGDPEAVAPSKPRLDRPRRFAPVDNRQLVSPTQSATQSLQSTNRTLRK